MSVLSRYWKIYRISLNNEITGYEYRAIPKAQEFLQAEIAKIQADDYQSVLLSCFNSSMSKNAASYQNAATAGLCLRCYVSSPILKACQKLDNLFGGNQQFSYQDLLRFVLNDDGETLIVLGEDGKTQLKIHKNGDVRATAYQFFTVKVLQTFKSNSKESMSLDNWAYLQTKQNPEVKDFLSEFGFQHLSDWAMLNRARQRQLECLSVCSRNLVETFHAVYRRDRLQQQRGAKRCPDPSNAQLLEMLSILAKHNVLMKTPAELMKELKQVASELRQFDVWSSREPLEIQDSDTGDYVLRTDLTLQSKNEFDAEEREFLDFLHAQLQSALNDAINQEVRANITKLEKSKKYAVLAAKFIPGLQMYYGQAMSLKDIAPQLGMTSWDQARRVLNPGELLSKIRVLTLQIMLENVLKKAQEKGLTTINPDPDYLRMLAEQIEAFAYGEIFQAAGEEIRAGKNRSMDSVYAQQLRLSLSNMYQPV